MNKQLQHGRKMLSININTNYFMPSEKHQHKSNKKKRVSVMPT